MIEMKNPIVEMDGDEMTRVLWGMIKDSLLAPFIDLKSVSPSTERRSRLR